MRFETVIGDDDKEVAVEFEFYPGLPAKLNAPMEDCYPEESSDVEITSIKHNGKEIQVSNADRFLLMENCLEAALDGLADYEYQKADYGRDQQLDQGEEE